MRRLGVSSEAKLPCFLKKEKDFQSMLTAVYFWMIMIIKC